MQIYSTMLENFYIHQENTTIYNDSCAPSGHKIQYFQEMDEQLLPIEKQTPQGLIKYIFPDFENLCFNPNYLTEQTIFAPKNEYVDEINERLLAISFKWFEDISQCWFNGWP